MLFQRSITDFFNYRNMSLGKIADDTNLNCFLFKRLISKLNNWLHIVKTLYVFRTPSVKYGLCTCQWVKGCVFMEKSKSEFPNPIGKSKNRSWIRKIHTLHGWILRIKSKSGFLTSTTWAFFWERIWKKVFLTSGFLSENETCRLFTFVDCF